MIKNTMITSLKVLSYAKELGIEVKEESIDKKILMVFIHLIWQYLVRKQLVITQT